MIGKQWQLEKIKSSLGYALKAVKKVVIKEKHNKKNQYWWSPELKQAMAEGIYW